MNKFEATVYKIEAVIASVLLCLISVLVFVSAVARTFGRPINWTQDFALLAFAWLTFLGSDVLARSAGFLTSLLVIKCLGPS